MHGGIVMPASALSTAALARETTISVVINCALTAAFYFLLFHGVEAVPIWGVGNFAFDFGPQTFMIALMGTMVPGLIASRKFRSSATPKTKIIQRALVVAVVALIVGCSITTASLWLLSSDVVAFNQGLKAKILYGGALAAIVTPLFLRAQFAAKPMGK